MVYPSGSIAYGDFYAIAGNGQGVVIKNSSANVTSAKAKGITPIAMVFHTSPSSTDQSKSWTHGYAMALKRASTSCHWSSVTNSVIQTNQYGAGNLTSSSSMTSELNRAKANLEGYSETKRILAKTSNSPSTSYPACYYAVTHSVTYPKSSSGWYLPSVGQTYYLFYNANSTNYSLISGYESSENDTRIGVSLTNGKKCISIVETKLSALSTSDYEWTTQCHIWLSSEVNKTNALIFYSGTSPEGHWYIYPHYEKTTSSAKVRSFIAF